MGGITNMSSSTDGSRRDQQRVPRSTLARVDHARPAASPPRDEPEQQRSRFINRRTFLKLAPLPVVVALGPAGAALALGSPSSLLSIVAHEDDDLLFLSPTVLSAVQGGGRVRTIYVTAGDAGLSQTYWMGRQNGMMAAYAEMAGVSNSWTQADAGVTGHAMPLYTLNAMSAISLIFMHLPDGSPSGTGFASTNFESLQMLWQGTITAIETADGSSSYTKSSLTSTLTGLISSFQPGSLNTQDFVGTFGDGDHSDHHAVAYFTQAAQKSYNASFTFTGYEDYPDDSLPANVTGSVLTAKTNAFYTYTPYDSQICQSPSSCVGTDYPLWLQRQYTTSQAYPPVANAGANQTVALGATVQLDGSGSTDPSGNPLTYRWSQTGGTQVTLSSNTTVKPTFTAPGSAATLTFQLVVNNGSVSSSPASVTIAVGTAQPPVANAGANQTVAVGSTVQLNGSGSTGSPLSYQWTQTGGYAQVTLSSSTVANPTFTAPANPDGLTFQLVVTEGTISSSPSTVVITVATTAAGPNLALSATATASSQTTSTGQTAAKAIDGAVGGYPGNYMEEWATNGGKAGSWLSLTWATAQTFDTIVLYDRPNLSDQITGGNIQFSDGTNVSVGTLPNNGAANVLSFAAKTVTSLQLNITSVSSSTQNVGLAEIQAYLSGQAPVPPVANAGANQTVAVGSTVQLNGSGSTGSPLSYQWTQTGGYAQVTLSSSTVANPTFTAPANPDGLTFQLVVTEGTISSSPSTVVITVATTAAGPNLALSATATASSQTTSTGQTAAKAIDGAVGGYPGNYMEEWATNGGKAGSWLSLTWATAQTFDTIVLYDRPNLSDQITGGNIQFSDGTNVSVGTLPNNGAANVLSFAAKTVTSLQLNITSVSSSTQNVGLAEIQAYLS